MHITDMCIPIKMLSTRAKMLFIDYVQHFGGFHIKTLREGVFGVKHSVLSISWAALFIQVTLKSPPIETYLARPCRFSVSPRSTGNHSPSLGTDVAHHDVLSRSAPWKMLDHQVTISGENFSVLIILFYFISFNFFFFLHYLLCLLAWSLSICASILSRLVAHMELYWAFMNLNCVADRLLTVVE